MTTPLIRNLRAVLGPENILSAPSELAVYDCDAFTVERRPPAAVVFPRSTEHVASIVRICGERQCPIVPRGAGTGLAGGCLPAPGGVVLMLTRMNRILEIRLRDALALVEPGVLNLQLTRALAGTGYHFAPDPSSQGTATIGGNVATNAGGPHTLKYGVTVNHIAGLEMVTGEGEVVSVGPVEDPAALDLAGVVCGSEGTLAIVTKIWARLTRDPQSHRTLRVAFASVDDATQAVTQIIAAGIIPAALELMDRGILDAVEEAFAPGVPRDAAALLVIELDGPESGLDAALARVTEICRTCKANEILQAATPADRELLWKCRKMAVGAVGRLSPGYVIQDGVVPRTRLPHVFRRIAEIAAAHRVRIVNVAHAGDGNVHPILLFDERDRDLMARVHAASQEILRECIACGGSITAEHGVGVEKIELMGELFSPADLRAMLYVRQSFDPAGRLNPGKKFNSAASTVPVPSASNTGSVPATMPANEVEMAAAVRGAFAAKAPVRVIGGGQQRPESGICLHTTGMNRVVDYQPDDMAVTIEAGITLAELNRTLAEQKQWLPLDPPDAAEATIGGIIASNAFGPRRYAYGTVRDYLLGIRAIDGQGEVFSGGGQVVKNAAGYNLPRLLVGSQGTLGIITQATFMVRPLPSHAAMVVCDLDDSQRTECLLAGLPRSRTTPVAVELLAGPMRLNCPLPAMHAGRRLRLVAGFEGHQAEIQGMAQSLCDEWQSLGGEGPTMISGAHLESVWDWLTGGPAMIEVNVLPSAVVPVVEQLSQSLPGVAIQAHAGNGVVRIFGSNDGQLGLPTDFAALVRDTLRPMATAAGGSLTVHAAPQGTNLAPDDLHGPPRPGAAVMRAIRRRFDPAGILNPGSLPP